MDEHMDCEGQILDLRRQLVAMKGENERLRKLAHRDDLTGLLTRRTFEEEVEPHLRQIVAFRDPTLRRRDGDVRRHFSLVILDLDRFKSVNDTLGHQAGDHALQELAKLIKRHRATNPSARWGGDEFVIGFVDEGIESALRFAEILREQVASTKLTWNGKPLPFTISVGVANFGDEMQNLKDLFEAADRTLYVAKNTGRDRVAEYNEAMLLPISLKQ